MPRPHPPPYVRKPGRKKTKRTREVGEKPTRTKLNKVGVQMQCSLCRKTTHNIRKCPYNKEAGKRKNSHIKRDAARKRKQSEAATVAEGSSVRKFHIAFLFFLFYQFSENYILILYVRAPKAPRAFAEAPRPAPAAGPRSAPTQSTRPAHAHAKRAAPAQTPRPCNTSTFQAPRAAAATSSHGPLQQAKKSITRTREISYLLFGDNY